MTPFRCPHCSSTHVLRSESRDSFIFRAALLTRMRCHSCLRKFFAPCWRVASRPTYSDRLAKFNAPEAESPPSQVA